MFVSGTTDQYQAVIDETLTPNSYFATILATDQDNKVRFYKNVCLVSNYRCTRCMVIFTKVHEIVKIFIKKSLTEISLISNLDEMI